MAAITAVSTFVKAGEHVVCSNMTYGGTYRYYTKIQARYGVEFSFVDTSDAEQVAARSGRTRGSSISNRPTNPTMVLCDIAALSDLAHEPRRARRRRQHVRLAVSPEPPRSRRGPRLPLDDEVLERPLRLGRRHRRREDAEHVEWLSFVQNSSGAILSPMDSWLVLRGIKTLVVRMERHEANGRAIARFLAGHTKVRKVNYPGLPDHPQHELAKRQMRGFGAMISFDLGSLETRPASSRAVRLCSLGESLGGVETLISHPATMTHASIPEPERNRLGVTPGLVRISVGIEDVEDLIADLERALSSA